ncbi:major capsid protein [Mycobacterium phage Phaded]|uniref:Major capsid protein n=1 Tax=Mycobacterium phage Phaded TaxID=2686088 RepID=A0A6B9J6L6_9CAUD|nr:major capsid protein [Mycobacterium phage Phaded]APC43167.1 major capsid protein [Mycobacterium phage Jaan]QGZ16820.1 major capsid protein [Mycobacterium phage Phaded]
MAAGTAFAVDHAQIAQTGDTMFKGYLEPEQAKDYFAEAEKTSIVQQFAQKIPMGTTGQKIPHWVGDVSAQWIGEGDMKPITKGNMGSQTIAPHKIATIFVASAETVRANPANYIGTMRTKVATAFAMAFDGAALNGTDSPFPTYLAQTTKSVSLADPGGAGSDDLTAYDAVAVNGLSLLVNAGKKWTHTLLDDIVEPILNGAKDKSGRPLFIESTYTEENSPFRLGRIVARPTILSDHVAGGSTVGYMGDFRQVVWGQVGGLSFDVTDQATLNLGTPDTPNFVSLWQHNLVAVRVEAEYAFHCNDKDAFVKLTNVVTP